MQARRRCLWILAKCLPLSELDLKVVEIPYSKSPGVPILLGGKVPLMRLKDSRMATAF